MEDWSDKFIAALGNSGNVCEAASLACINPRTAYYRRKRDSEFRKRWKEATTMAADALEAEARRRAVEGVEEPVYHNGVPVGTIRKYSDTLLIFLLKGNKPKKFMDRAAVRHSGSVGHKHDVNVNIIADPQANELADALARRLESIPRSPDASSN